jgi:hypothetical protein
MCRSTPLLASLVCAAKIRTAPIAELRAAAERLVAQLAHGGQVQQREAVRRTR